MFVSNTSTLILLAKITLFKTFINNSPKIIIPEEVRKEYLKKDSFDAKLIEREIEQKRIIVEKDNANINKIIEQFHLDFGEAAAYALFDKNKHKAILTDDGELIKLCKLENVPFICSMAIVFRLYERRLITKEETLEKMERLTKLGRYSKEIYEYYKNQVK